MRQEEGRGDFRRGSFPEGGHAASRCGVTSVWQSIAFVRRNRASSNNGCYQANIPGRRSATRDRWTVYPGSRSWERLTMRGGVLLENLDPAAGGGYTFQSDIFDALLAIGEQSRHFFVLLCHPDTAAKLPRKLLSNAEVVALDIEQATPGGLFARSKPVSKPRSLEEQLRAAHVDFVWQFGALGQVLDTPYMVVVWDLQHRLQPWFPEVSANG